MYNVIIEGLKIMNKSICVTIFSLYVFTCTTFSEVIYEDDKNVQVGFGVGIALRNNLKTTSDFLTGTSAANPLNVELYVPIIFKMSSRFEPEFSITYFNSNGDYVKIQSTRLRLGIGVFPFILRYKRVCFEPGFRMGYTMSIQKIKDDNDSFVTLPDQSFYNPYVGLAASTEIFLSQNVSIATEMQIPVNFIKPDGVVISTEGTLGLRFYFLNGK